MYFILNFRLEGYIISSCLRFHPRALGHRPVTLRSPVNIFSAAFGLVRNLAWGIKTSEFKQGKESYRHSIKSFLIAQRPNVYNGIWWFKKLFLTGSNLIFKDRDPTKFHNTEFVFLAYCFTYPAFVPIIAIKIVLWIWTVSNDSDFPSQSTLVLKGIDSINSANNSPFIRQDTQDKNLR